MTSGGITPQKRWREVDYFPFKVLHKKWQYYLQWSRQKSGGDSAVSSEFVIAGMIFHPSRVKS
jgi:hypothetical protein